MKSAAIAIVVVLAAFLLVWLGSDDAPAPPPLDEAADLGLPRGEARSTEPLFSGNGPENGAAHAPSSPDPAGADRAAIDEGIAMPEGLAAPSPATRRTVPRHALSGRLVDGEGKPIAGGAIYVMRLHAPSGTPYHVLRTDAEGRFSTPPHQMTDTLRLVPARPGASMPLGEVKERVLGTNHQIVVRQGRTLRIRVNAGASASVPSLEGTQVQVVYAQGLAHPVRVTTALDAKGEARVGGIEDAASDTWHAYTVDVGPVAGGFFAFGGYDTRSPPENDLLELRLDQGVTTRGRVTGPEGARLDVRVVATDLRHIRRETRADAEGRFAIEGMSSGSVACFLRAEDTNGLHGPATRCASGDDQVLVRLPTAAE